MKLSGIISEANDVAEKYNLQLVEIDSTNNIINLKLLIDNDLFIQILGNLSETLFVNRWNSWKAGIYYRPDVPGSVRRI